MQAVRESDQNLDGEGIVVTPVVEAPAGAVSPERTVPSVRRLLLVIAANVLIALALFVNRPPWYVERVTVTLPLPAQVEQLRQRVERGDRGAAYAVSLTNDDLTATARHFLARREDVPFTQVRLVVSGGLIEADGVTTGLAIPIPVRVIASLEARDGAPLVRVVDISVGGLSLPVFVRAQVLRDANRTVDLSQYDLPVTVDTVELRPGILVVEGTVKQDVAHALPILRCGASSRPVPLRKVRQAPADVP